MRFGRDLYRYRVSAWADEYINYDELKEQLKSFIASKEASEHGESFGH